MKEEKRQKICLKILDEKKKKEEIISERDKYYMPASLPINDGKGIYKWLKMAWLFLGGGGASTILRTISLK